MRPLEEELGQPEPLSLCSLLTRPPPPPGPGLSPLPVPCVPGGLTPSEPQGQAGVEGAGGHGPAGSRAWGLPRVRRGPETSGEEEGKAEGESGRETPRRHLWVEQQGL